MRPPVYTAWQRHRALLFAVVGNLVPLGLATANDFGSHRTAFFVGLAIAVVTPIVVVMAPQDSRVRLLFALAGIPALTAMQAYSGGVGSAYAVLLIMPTIWFGLQARRPELAGGLAMIAGCCFVPMLVFGSPAYPLDWLQATLLLVVTGSVAGALATVSRETWRLTAALREQAQVDDLTGLLNRRGWTDAAERELARARRLGCGVGLVAIDLDGLKSINDTLGHDGGDRLLRETALRMRSVFRAQDVVARLGGDEFSLLLVDATVDDTFAVLERLHAATPANGEFSAGVALGSADESLDDLQRRADLALYEAKHRGGGTTVGAERPPWSTVAAAT